MNPDDIDGVIKMFERQGVERPYRIWVAKKNVTRLMSYSEVKPVTTGKKYEFSPGNVGLIFGIYKDVELYTSEGLYQVQ